MRRARPSAGAAVGEVPARRGACDVTKTFQADGVPVRRSGGVDIELRRGEFAAIMGPSGSGKSTLLHLLGGLERPTSGESGSTASRVDGLSQAGWAKLRRRRHRLHVPVLQPGLNMTVADDVELAALMGGASAAGQGASRRAPGRPGPERQGRRGAGSAVRRRAAAGGPGPGLANRPSLLLADEPTASLDSSGSQSVLGSWLACTPRGRRSCWSPTTRGWRRAAER